MPRDDLRIELFRSLFVQSYLLVVDVLDCPTQLTLISMLWYLYLSVVFHDKYQGYKYEKIQQGNMLLWTHFSLISRVDSTHVWTIKYKKVLHFDSVKLKTGCNDMI